MHDLPSIALLQQSHAIPKSGEELEVLGKAAAKKYASGRCPTLNEAVVDTVKHGGLSPEQVRRVVEFANVNAYLSEFGKEGSAHKYVEFNGGPANPAEVLRDLNDGGGGTVFDRGLADYSHDPETPKTASLLSKNMAVMERMKTAAVHLGVASMNDVFDDMATDASRRHQAPPYAGFDPFGDQQRKAQVHMLSAMTGRQPVVHKYAEIPMDPGIMPQQPSLSDETRSMIGGTGGELASAGPGTEDPNAPPGVPGYDPLPEHMKLMAQHMKLMQTRAGGGTQAPSPATPAGDPLAPKVASLDFNPSETMLEQAFSAVDEPYPYANPMQDSLELHDKLAGAADHLTSELSMLETAFHDTLDQVYHEVKVAALEGVPLGQVLAAWQQVVPSPEYVKTAFMYIGPRLQKEGVFESLDDIGASLEKTAHRGMVNTEHPLISTMADYCTVLDKLAEVREARDELTQERNRLDFFLKRAAALIPRMAKAVQSGANRAGEVLGSAAERGAGAVLTDNPETAALIGRGVKTLTKAAPATVAGATGLVAADEVYDRAKYSPTVRKGTNLVLSHAVPSSVPYQQREYALAQKAQQRGF